MTLRNITWSIALGFILSSHLGLAATTTRVSVSSLGQEGNEESCCEVAISRDGRFVAFQSDASNLVANDTNGVGDIFVHDREAGETTRVSVNSRGKEANARSWRGVAISASGRFVAFASEASNLVADDTNGESDVFVHDRKSGKTTRVSVNSQGQEANEKSRNDLGISGDGRLVTFASQASNLVANDTNSERDVFVHDRQSGETARASVNSQGRQGNNDSSSGSISENGRFVVFSSDASNLVADDTNVFSDVFVHDRKSGKTTRISVNSQGQEANDDSGYESIGISADGRFVVFVSDASNLVSDDTNETDDVFMRDRKSGKTTRVNVSSLGQEANEHVDGESAVAISGDGRFVAFNSEATNLVPDDTNGEPDIFVHDRQAGETTRVSVNSLGQEGDEGSHEPIAINRNGRFVAFSADARNLVSNDTNEAQDFFIADRDRDIVNAHVNIDPKASSFQMVTKGQECAGGFVGRLLFNTRLENTGDVELKKLHVPVAKLTGRNKLVTKSGLIGPNGEFPVPERGDYADAILGPGESVGIPLEVCLRNRKPFKLYVDVADDRKTKVYESAPPRAEFRFIVGLDRDDTLKGTSGDDMIIGFHGNDTVSGKGGNDLILGGRGNDDLSGNRGNDEIRGGDGRDALRGDKGEDLLLGGQGNDSLLGNGGDDELRGNGGDDQLNGGNDDDLLLGGSGNDGLDGGQDVDICKGGSGNNTLSRCEL